MADRAQAPQGDAVFCHECYHEWPRAEHGLRCPECASEFTETIEEENDPRQMQLGDNHAHPPLLQTDAPFPDGHHHHHHHFHPPPEDTIMGSVQAIHYGDDPDPARPAGSVRYTSVIYRTVPPTDEPPQPSQEPRDTGAHFHDFQQMMESLTGGLRGDPSPNHTAGTALHPPTGSDQPGSTHFGPPDEPSAGRRSYQVLRTRTTYVPNVGLAPRDANNAQPQAHPVDGLSGLMQTLAHELYGSIPDRGPEAIDPLPRQALNPIMAVFGGLIHPRDGSDPDVVYTQEALDGVISQLMEQNSGSNAPGPASEAAIASLPRVTIDLKMLGDTGKAECTICMDDVPVGQIVMSLPCGHWFHEACGTAWLNEHNTCPICRKGISVDQDGNHHDHQPQPQDARRAPRHEAPPSSNVEPWQWTGPPRPNAPRRASTGGSNGDRSGLTTTIFTTTTATIPDGTPGAAAGTTTTTTITNTENGQPVLLANGRPRQPLVLPPPIHNHYPPEIEFMFSSGPANNGGLGGSDPLTIASGSASGGRGGGGDVVGNDENRRRSPGVDPPRRRLVRGGGGASTSFLGGIGPVTGNHGGDDGNGGGISDRVLGWFTGGNGNGGGAGGGGDGGNGSAGGGRGGNGDVGNTP